MNPFTDMIERYEHELEQVKFDSKILSDYRSNLSRMGMDLNAEDMNGLFYMQGKIEVYKDILSRLQMINGMISFVD